MDVKDDRSVDSLHGGVGWEFFLVDEFSLELQLNGFVFDQPGPDQNPVAANFALLMRWYLFRNEHIAFYLDGGIGLLYASAEVPRDGFGTEFNFTPQGGAGVSFPIGEGRTAWPSADGGTTSPTRTPPTTTRAWTRFRAT